MWRATMLLGTQSGCADQGEGTLIFSYIRRLGSFWGIQNFEFHYFWGFQKNEYFGGYEDFVDILGGSSQIGLNLGVISLHFRVFS